MPAGIADEPPYTEIAFPGCKDVPAANVWRTDVPSESVHPAMLIAVPPTLTISTASPAVLLPGSLARTSLRITCAGPLLVVTETEWVVVPDAEPLSVTVSDTV